MRKHTTLDERMKMITLAQQGLSSRAIAEQMRLSVHTVRKWRRRYRQQGKEGLYSRMGRPKRGVLSTFAPEVKQALSNLRKAHPGWGPLSLLAALRKDPHWEDARLPSRSQVACFLKAEGWTTLRRKRSQLPESVSRPAHPRPHQEWEMDAQGVIDIPGLGRATVINIVDVATSLHIGAWLCPHRRKPNGKDYRRALRLAFAEFGLPEHISLDHDTAFVGTNAHSPFPTTFLLWVFALGVKVRFIQAPPPREHARVEGRHALHFAQALEGRTFPSWQQVQEAMDAQRHFTNAIYPAPELGNRPRLESFPEARHSGRGYHPEHEEALLDLQRVKAYLQQGQWYRQVSGQGQCALGGHRYTLGKAWAKRQVEVRFDATRDALRFAWKEEVTYCPMKGLDKTSLMGSDAPWMLSSNLQLPLPFEPGQALALQAYVHTIFPDSMVIRV